MMKLVRSSGRLSLNVNRVMIGKGWPSSRRASCRIYAMVIMESAVRITVFEVSSQKNGTSTAEK